MKYRTPAEPISCGLADVLALDMNPQRAAGLYAQALAQLQNGDAAAAEQALRELALLRPDDAAVLQLQAAVALALRRPGQALLMAQDWPRAVLAFDRLLALQSDNPEGYYGRALAWRALGQHGKAGKAGKDASQALRLQPDHTGALQEQANAILQAGAFDRALAAFAELEGKQPGAPFVACLWLFLARQLCRWAPLGLPLLTGETPLVAEDATADDVAAAELATLRLRAQRGEPALEPFATLVLYDDPALHKHVAGMFMQKLHPQMEDACTP
jgi:predicted Zn-dependent protease